MKFRQIPAVVGMWFWATCFCFGQNAVPAQRINLAPSFSRIAAELSQSGTTVADDASRAAGQIPNAGAAVSTTESSATANPDRTKQRTAALSKLTFDRRASSILEAWSTPFKEQEDAPKNPDDEKETEQAADAQPAESTAPDEPLTAEQQAAKEAADKVKAAAEELAQEIKQLKIEVRRLQRNVTQGDWAAVGKFFASLEKKEPQSVYQQLLQSLVVGPPDSPRTRTGAIIGEKNVIRATDVIALGELCPDEKLEDAHIVLLGQLVGLCQAEGQAEYLFLERLKEHVAANDEKQKINNRVAARILFAAGRIEQSHSFLPKIEDANKDNDVEALSILTDVYLSLFQKETDKALLEQSWKAAQALLMNKKSDKEQKQKAMQRCVQLVPMLRAELGQQWLTDSFTSAPERGMEILAGIGSASANSMKEQLYSPEERVATLKLQQTAVNALLKTAPDKAESWGSTLHLLAINWLREATYSRQYDQTSQRGPRMTRDQYGNYFWSSSGSSNSAPQGMPQPIKSGEVLDVRPGAEWLRYLEPGYASQFSIETARLHRRVKEEEAAFPYIEQLAETHKDEATELVQEFLDVWAANHDPNTESQRSSIYMFSYGFSQRASGIPLTRSRQVRNLDELSGWVERIRKLPLDDIKESWISAAFTRVHSSAEVYQRDDLERVFGNIDAMEADTLAALLQTMRTNLAGIWRKPETQQQSGTKRKQKEIEAEVVKGYEAARLLLNKALDDHPNSWELLVAKAAIMHDENDYRGELQNSSEFATARKSALATFAKSVEAYAAKVPELKETEYSIEPFQFWFYATLGAADLDQINQDKLPVLNQIPLIKAAFEVLPEECRAKHVSMFANDLFTRMSRVNPGVKFRYLREGLAIVGNHEQAAEAQKVFDYYQDLVTEIKLETVVDGSTTVGHDHPFGVYVNLRHTKAIERESGGFAKYLQNQNNGSYYYNYGRPTENYREKFEQAARDALDEHFEVLSVTFQPETVSSKATEQEGWRTTSYAYLLLKPRGPEIDRVAPLKLDLDFLDTTGYAVLPVESQALLIDCRTEQADSRPFEKLTVTQTLDERQAKDKKLVLEIKANAQGLVPELHEILDLKFSDFEVSNIEDNGLAVSRFDPEASTPVVVSDRLWTLTLTDKDVAAKESRQFMFASAKVDTEEEIWQKYDDADLVAVEQAVTLQEAYDEPPQSWLLYALGIAVAVLGGSGLLWWMLKKPHRALETSNRFEIPDQPTPFNVLSLLKDIQSNNGLSPENKTELATSINRIERYFFAEERDSDAPNLQEVAQSWVRKAR